MGSSDKSNSEEMTDLKKMKILLPHWVTHNREHSGDYGRWIEKAEHMGMNQVADQLRQAVEKIDLANKHLEAAARLVVEQGEAFAQQAKSHWADSPSRPTEQPSKKHEMVSSTDVSYRSIGVIHTPYKDNAPYQPVEEDNGSFILSLEGRFSSALHRLEDFRYIYVLYHIHRSPSESPMTMTPSWAGGVEVGTFASRSPVRPNPIGLSIVKIKKIEGSEIWTSGLDAFDGTPLLDIKPYIKDLDSKNDANYGWVAGLDDYEHLLLHIKGIPHDY